jgi:Rrf2 family iron-sulfur cluster assembly transcriptional regulator
VRAKRGPGGGYTLSRSASEINVRDIVEAVEGPVGLATQREPEPSPAAREDPGSQGEFRPDFLWGRLSERFAAVLAETTIERLCAQAARARVPRSGADAYAYQI